MEKHPPKLTPKDPLIFSTMELVCEKNLNKKAFKKKEIAVMKNLPYIYTNADTLTNKMHGLIAYV